jgi:hypothetical protein
VKRLAAVVALLGITTAATAMAAPRDVAQEAAIDEAVAAVDPSLVATLHEGNAAMDRGDAATAAQKYGLVHAQAPDVAPVTRRLCSAETRSGEVERGILHCREALAKDDSPENHAALAVALLAKTPSSQADQYEAKVEAWAAVSRAPTTEYAQTTLCEVSVQTGDTELIEQCSTALRSIAPHSPSTHLFTAITLASHKKIDEAEQELEVAHGYGLDDKTFQSMHERFELGRPKPNVAFEIAEGALVAWLASIFVVLVLGLFFSDAAARGKAGRSMRAAYRGLIVGATALFYVSGLLGALLLLAFVAAIVFAFLWMSEASRVVQAVVGLVSAYVVVAALRALLGRVEARELGRRIDLDEEPALRDVLDGLAKRLRMPKLDAVYVEPDAAIEVVESGGAFGHLRGKNTRSLVIGVAALEGLSVRELEALVARELARFREREGAGGDVAVVECAALDDLAERMEIRGVATAANPAWWFVRAYRAMFERITEGAIELQEDLADERAAKAYGSATLVSGLRHLARRGIEIESRTTASLRGVLDGGALDDVYARDSSGETAEAIDEALAELSEREKRITALDEVGYTEADEDDAAPAWSLFSDRTDLEHEMTDRLRALLRDHVGFEIEPDQESKASSVARA